MLSSQNENERRGNQLLAHHKFSNSSVIPLTNFNFKSDAAVWHWS